ncbi:MAG: hypothetical protein AAB880_02155 [Patescibacteria group bacterium]
MANERFCSLCGTKLTMIMLFGEVVDAFCPKDGLTYKGAEAGANSPEMSLQAQIERLSIQVQGNELNYALEKRTSQIDRI